MKDKIVVIGGGGHAKVIISILKKLNNYEIAGYTDIESKGEILGVLYLGNDNILNPLYNEGVKTAVIGIGQIKSSELRKKIVNKLIKIGFDFPVIISPDCIINEEVSVGKGTIIMDGVVINSGSSIGEFSIINTNSSIDHDCIIGSYTHVAPGATLSGGVIVGNNVLLGTGSNIIHNVRILDGSIISAGSTVLKSIIKKGVYRGIPADFIREI